MRKKSSQDAIKKIQQNTKEQNIKRGKGQNTITIQKTMNKIAIIILLPQLITLKVNRYSPIKRHREAEWNKTDPTTCQL